MCPVEFGYACTSVLVKDCSPARTVTLKRLEAIDDRDDRLTVLRKLAQSNLGNTRRLLWHNIAHGLRLYRMTSNLVPLCTHPIAAGWDWESELHEEFHRLGEVVQRYGLRVSTHPGAYTVLSSPHAAVRRAAMADLAYHARCFELMGVGYDGRINIHVGGAQGGQEAAMERFAESFALLPEAVRSRLTLENDDVVYSATDVLALCQLLGIPMVLDIHHDWVNPGAAPAGELLDDIFATWDGAARPPTVHVSSPRSEQEPRAHAPGVNPLQFRSFLTMLNGRDCDVMVEAKETDKAVLDLLKALAIPHPPLTAPVQT